MGEVLVSRLSDLIDYGAMAENGATLAGISVYERPAQMIGPVRIRHCRIGAFSIINGDLGMAAFDTIFGRYCSIGGLVGAPDHPIDWFSTHPFTFMRASLVPKLAKLPDLVRLLPDGTEDYTYPRIPETVVGHDCWIGAGSVIRRGLKIGTGSIIGAQSVVTRDVPPYAIVTGIPGEVKRLRFPEKLVERLLALEWWRYDLAPHKHAVNFSQVERTVDVLSQLKADGKLDLLVPDTYRAEATPQGWKLEKQSAPLFV